MQRHDTKERSLYALYNTLLLALLPFGTFYYLGRLIRRSYRKGFAERLGRIGLEVKGVLWFHAVSVGEVNAVAPLIRRFMELYPQERPVLSTVTPTGREMARKALPSVDLFYLPLDLPWIVKRTVARVRPKVLCLVETEIWPNLLRRLREEGIPVVVVNGRLSERSFRRYMRFRSFFREVFNGVNCFSVQGQEDARRLLSLGIDREKIFVTGNIKYHQDQGHVAEEDLEAFAEEIGLRPTHPVIVGGSTHRGEESVLIEAFKRLRERFPFLKLILVPRHPERAQEVEEAVRRAGLTCARRTREGGFGGKDVLLVDTIGELKRLYALSTVAFVGGSLVRHGGQNMIEPAYYRKPVLFGPHVENFLSIARDLKREGGGIMVRDGEELFSRMEELLSDPALCKGIGEAGYRVVERGKGALERNIEIIRKVIDGPLREDVA